MHLVRWEVLKRPISKGGLQIRDLGLAYLEMTGKLIWQLFVDTNHPVSRIFRMKYLKGGSLRFVNFSQHLFSVPVNGKRTLLWEDKISGKPPLSFVFQLSELMDWSKNKGLLRLADICIWDSDGNWEGWLSQIFQFILTSKNQNCSLFYLDSPLFTSPKKIAGVGASMALI